MNVFFFYSSTLIDTCLLNLIFFNVSLTIKIITRVQHSIFQTTTQHIFQKLRTRNLYCLSCRRVISFIKNHGTVSNAITTTANIYLCLRNSKKWTKNAALFFSNIAKNMLMHRFSGIITRNGKKQPNCLSFTHNTLYVSWLNR